MTIKAVKNAGLSKPIDFFIFYDIIKFSDKNGLTKRAATVLKIKRKTTSDGMASPSLRDGDDGANRWTALPKRRSLEKAKG
jgi:hypothetical protein